MPAHAPRPITRALISTFDKVGVADLARALADLGVEVVSTGSTAAAIRDAGVNVTEVSAVTGFPEVMDGRVKTLHPHIHAGILADRDNPAHLEVLEAHGIGAIDLVVANLYPFAKTVADPDVTPAQAIEMIDIGGPSMVRAAAKNHAHVAVLVDPGDYDELIGVLRTDGGTLGDQRTAWAKKAFAHTAAYDAQVAAWLRRDEAFPTQLDVSLTKAAELRYGENPHQRAAWYLESGEHWGIGSVEQLGGKELSSNNLLDADAAWGLVADLADPAVAIIKHTNPAGCAVADSLAAAYPRALAGDEVSAFGGIVAANRTVDAATARQIVEVFAEVVVAPDYDDDARDVLATKKNLRILRIANPSAPEGRRVLRHLAGGMLVTDPDLPVADDADTWQVVTTAQPDEATRAELAFAWVVAKHTKSNAIVLTSDRAVVGVGAGQMSRVDSVRIAVDKSRGRAEGSVLASDAFFPFADGPEAAIAAGIRAIVQPGGSVRDAEVIAACDAAGIPMVVTGRRHFLH